ncbi:MAG TPA: class II aldolase/adducin family protein [Terracidiphilus sp.]|jgi:L-fuculose-phosphate aldolase
MERAYLLESPASEQVREVVRAAVEVLREPQALQVSPSAAVNSFEADALRAEIIAVGRKLWERKYVDGAGGNISARLNSEYVLCTPTMLSKRDLQPADICLTDLDGNILAGDRLRTSELLLHLEIYRCNPRARAVVHCHPPHATAFALTGSAPPNGYLSEFEFFIGPVAVAPYETPGTPAFAQTVRPFAQDHNTILLANHGVVCWSDTVTHAEWLAEILETWCTTYLIAQQLGRPLHRIAEPKLQELLAAKQCLGWPDSRISREGNSSQPVSPAGDADVDRLVERVLGRLDHRG